MNVFVSSLQPLVFLLYLLLPGFAQCQPTPTQVQLANTYDNQDIRLYLVSEKYDGVRAVWKDGMLRTRQGNRIHAPDWFTQDLPDMWLDGELWIERNNFSAVISTVNKKKPVDSEWRNIKYMVFDCPQLNLPFSDRVRHYTELIERLNLNHLVPVEQFTVATNSELSTLLERYTQYGAEGLMLHRANALFSAGRSDTLLKLKKHNDAEAVVKRHIPGKGKYKGMLGALLVEFKDQDDKVTNFKIGTGFSQQERLHPPAIGQRITFKYHGLTKHGVPRFASFLRIDTSQGNE